MEQARLALDDLDKSDVTEIRSFAKPPKAVQVVSECICVFKGYKEISWKTAKGMMSDTNFLQSLQTMDVDNITSKQSSTVKGNNELFSFILLTTVDNSLFKTRYFFCLG